MEGCMLQGVEKNGASSSCDIRINTHPCKLTDIRTISEIMAEKGPKATKLMTNLTNIIEFKNRRLEVMESKYMETRDTISKLVAEYDEIHQAYYEEMKEMQFSIREHFQWIYNDHELMNLKLETQEKELELRGIELHKREVINEKKRKKLTKEIEENAAKKSSLDEQRKANKRMLTLADDHKKEKEKLQEKIFFLENQLNKKQALETEIERLMRKLNVVKHTGDDGSEVMKKIEEIKKNIKEKEEVMKKIEEMKTNIKEKEEELEELESLFETLDVRKRKSNDELQEARKELIQGFKELKYSKIEAEDIALELCSFFEENLGDPYPYRHRNKVITVNGKPQGIIVEKEEKHENLMTSNLRCVGTELWNSTESRKATLKEGVSCILKVWGDQKRRRFT